MRASSPSALGGPVGGWYWALAIAQACHSIEEMRARLYDFFWTATGRFQQWVPAFPRVRMSAATFAILNMTFIAFLLACVPFVIARRKAALLLAGAVGVIEIANGAGHLAGTILFSGYVPGAATAPFLIATGTGVLLTLRRAFIGPSGGPVAASSRSSGGERRRR